MSETSDTPSTNTSKRPVLRRTGLRILLGFAASVVLVRAVLPEVLRRVAVAQADKILVGRIEIDDIDLALLAGGVTLKGLRVYADDLPSPHAPAASGAPTTASSAPLPTTAPPPPTTVKATQPEQSTNEPSRPATAAEPSAAAAPIFTAALLSVDVAWRPLFRKIVELESIDLEHFDAHIDRLRDGTLVLPQPVPSPAPETPAPQQGPGWGVLLQELALRNGTIAFRDFTVGPDAKPLTATIPSLEAKNMALLITDTGLQPGTVSLDAEVLGGHLTAEMTQQTLPTGAAFQSHVVLSDLPISDALFYIPRLKWIALDGKLDLDLEHEFEPEGRNTVSGNVALRDMAVRVADLDAPPLAWKRLALDIAEVDLVKHGARLSQIALEGARLTVRAGGPEPLPILRGLADTTSSSPSTAPPQAQPQPQSQSQAQPQPQGEQAPSPPWTWQVDKVAVRDSAVDVLGGEKPLTLSLSSEVGNLASAPKTRSNVTLNIKPPAGALALTGEFTIEPLGFDGSLKLDGLSLPSLSEPIATPMTRLLDQGTLSTDLRIAAGASKEAPRDGAKIAGTVSLDDVVVTGDDDKAFAVRWKRVGMDIDSILAPGVLAKDKTSAAQPLSIALASFTFERPEFVLTRTEKGIVLPEPLGGEAGDAGAREGEPSRTEAAAAENAASKETAPGPRPAAPVEVRIDRVSVAKMRIAVTDKAVKPLYRSSLDPIDISASDVRWPGPNARALTVAARGLDGAKLSIAGDVSPSGSKVRAELDGLPLQPLNPYASGAGYGLGGGTASLHSDIKLSGENYQTDNKLVLNRPRVTGAQADARFASQFGMPLNLALALMTDLQGNITLNVPVTGGRSGTTVGVGTAVRDALKQAILATATSPLKLIGAVADIGQKPASLTPQPVAFALGRNREAEGEGPKVERLAKLLSSSAALALRLHGETSEEDRRWLAEQKLRAKIEKESGFLGSVRHIGEGDDREAALAYLQARAEDKAAELPEEHRKWFETAVAEEQVSDAELRALAEQRAAALRDRLTSSTKGDPARIVLDQIAPEDLAARAAVSVTLETTAVPQAAIQR